MAKNVRQMTPLEEIRAHRHDILEACKDPFGDLVDGVLVESALDGFTLKQLEVIARFTKAARTAGRVSAEFDARESEEQT